MSNVVTENIDVLADISHSNTCGCRAELSAIQNISDQSLINLVGTRILTVEHGGAADFISKNINNKQGIEAPPPGPKC